MNLKFEISDSSRKLPDTVNNPTEPSYPGARDEPFALPENAAPFHQIHSSADDPPWDVPVAIFVWLMSVAMIALVPAVVFVLYAFGRNGALNRELFGALALSPAGIVVQVAATLPAHLLTLGVVWLVATGVGRRPFLRVIGWRRSSQLPPLLWATLWVMSGIGLWVASWILTALVINLIGAEKTSFERLIESSPEARIAIVVLAVLTAPLVEEVVYRGVVYPAFKRAFGVAFAIFGVAALFAIVHVPQYWNNPGLIVGLAFLSVALTVVRARTGSILPCFIIHLVFNTISAALLLLEPTLKQFEPKAPPTAGGAEALIVWLSSLPLF